MENRLKELTKRQQRNLIEAQVKEIKQLRTESNKRNRQLKKLKKNNDKLQKRNNKSNKYIKDNKQYTDFGKAVYSSKHAVSVGELAKIAKSNGVEIGQNRLFKWLQDKDYIIKATGINHNRPTQYAMKLGLFKLKYHSYYRSGRKHYSTTTIVTPKGQHWIINDLLNEFG